MTGNDILKAEGKREAVTRVEIADFRGDYDRLADMMQQSWAQNNEQPLRYTADFLRSAFRYPNATLKLAPTVYRGDDHAAFIAAFPRTVQLYGRTLRLVLDTFLTVAVEYKSSGYGGLLWREVAKRAQTLGYDGRLSYCVEGDEMNRMVPGLGRLMKLPTARIFSIPYVAKILTRKNTPDEPREPMRTGDVVSVFLKSASLVVQCTKLARVWTKEEAEWQCASRYGAVTIAHIGDGRSGIVTGYIIEVDRTPPVNCLIIEDLLWGDLQPNERVLLLNKFLAEAIRQGAQVAVSPLLGYADTEVLLQAGFHRSRRVVHSYLTLWNGELPSDPLVSIYMDVY